jgi:uncharacterized protein (DUF4415 family)
MSKERITRVTRDELDRLKDETDDARLDAMTDDDIARAVADDPTMAPIGSIDWDKAALVIPPMIKDVITLRVDHDVLEWLRSTGPGYQTRINQVLRAWRDATLYQKRRAIHQKQALTAAEEQLLARLRDAPREPSAKQRQATSKALAAALKRPAKKAAAKRPAPAKKHA